MKFWNYIGEFLLFRWLFSNFRKSTTQHHARTEGSETAIDRDSKYLDNNHNEDITPIDDAVTAVGDDLTGYSDNSEDLDDLDIFMRNNQGNNLAYTNHVDYDRDYHSSGRHRDLHDWGSGSHTQSYDDFHDEQDDYDMMDDDF